jgi:hypothetical protein
VLNVTGAPVVGTSSCGPEFTNTRRIPVTWANDVGNIHVDTAKHGHFGPGDAIVLEILTPAVLGKNSIGAFQWSDYYPNPVANRVVVLSDRACDFTRGLDGSARAIADGYPSGVVYFSTVANDYGLPVISAPNSTYFLNIKNAPGGCSEAFCDLDIEFVVPKK